MKLVELASPVRSTVIALLLAYSSVGCQPTRAPSSRDTIMDVGRSHLARDEANRPTAIALQAFRNEIVMESYLIVAGPPNRSCIVARFDFDFESADGRVLGQRTVTTDDGEYPAQKLKPEEVERLLKEFRGFNWHAEPVKKEEWAVLFSVGPTRIAFEANTAGVYRAFQADTDSYPFLAALVDEISPLK